MRDHSIISLLIFHIWQHNSNQTALRMRKRNTSSREKRKTELKEQLEQQWHTMACLGTFNSNMHGRWHYRSRQIVMVYYRLTVSTVWRIWFAGFRVKCLSNSAMCLQWSPDRQRQDNLFLQANLLTEVLVRFFIASFFKKIPITSDIIQWRPASSSAGQIASSGKLHALNCTETNRFYYLVN